MPDLEFLGQVTEAIEILKTSHIEKRAKDRILSTLNSAKKPSTKNALREFAKNGVISESLVKIWVRLKNKAAHADQLKRNKQELQKFLDDVHGAHGFSMYCYYFVSDTKESISSIRKRGGLLVLR